MSRKFWVFVLSLLFLMVLAYAVVLIFSSEETGNKLIILIGSIGGVFLLFNFIGFSVIREYYFYIISNEYVDDQNEMLVLLAGINNNIDLVKKYYKQSTSLNVYFKEAIYMGAEVQSAYKLETAKAYVNIIAKLLDEKLIEGLSKEVLRLNLVKIIALIHGKEENETYLDLLKENQKMLRKSNSKYFHFMKRNDPSMTNLLV